MLREFLDDKRSSEEGKAEVVDARTDKEAGESRGTPPSRKAPDTEKLKKAIIQVTHKGSPAHLILTRRPPAEGYAQLKYDDGSEMQANLAEVALVALVEG